MLSERAEALPSFLRTIPSASACENCAAAYLGIDRYDALKAIREVILAGRIRCEMGTCSLCQERWLIAHLRRERPLGSRAPRD